MSGFLPTSDDPTETTCDDAHMCELEVIEGAIAKVGAFDVRRSLPRRARRTVGNWCFVDHMGPGTVNGDIGLDVAPHPHIGLQTVTWLYDGGVLHRDSLGTEQMIRAGQLNVMTAGHGVSHSEETVGFYSGPLHGMQLWLALPLDARNIEAGFEHHEDLPQLDVDGDDTAGRGGATATVVLGNYAGQATSPARLDSPVVAVDLDLRAGRSVITLDPSFEYALVIGSGPDLAVGASVLSQGQLGYLGIGRDEVAIEATDATRALLLGGVPRTDPLVMWWNYVAPTRDEILTAHHDWTVGAERFGTVASPLERLVPDPPLWRREADGAAPQA